VQCFLVITSAASLFEPVSQAIIGSDVRGQTGDAAQFVAALEHGLIAIMIQLGGGQRGSRLQAAAVLEHGFIATNSQLGGGQRRGCCAQTPTVFEHLLIAMVSQLGGGQVGSRGQFVAAPEHGLIAIVIQLGGGQRGGRLEVGAALEHVCVTTYGQRGGGQRQRFAVVIYDMHILFEQVPERINFCQLSCCGKICRTDQTHHVAIDVAVLIARDVALVILSAVAAEHHLVAYAVERDRRAASICTPAGAVGAIFHDS